MQQQQQLGLNQVIIQTVPSQQVVGSEPQKDLRNLLSAGNQPIQKMPMQQQGWINTGQQSQPQQQQIYMNANQQQRPNSQNFGSFDSNNQYQN